MRRSLALRMAVFLSVSAGAWAITDGPPPGQRLPPPPTVFEGPPPAPEVPELLGDAGPLSGANRFQFAMIDIPEYPPLVDVPPPPPLLVVDENYRRKRIWRDALGLGGYGPDLGSGGSAYSY